MDKERLLSHLRGEDERRIGDHVLGLAKLAWETNKPQVTDFYDPYQQQVARSVLGSIPEVGVLVQGGYKQAERARLVVYPQFYVMSAIQSPLRVLEAKGNFSFHNVGHGDFLGSLLATGLDRDKIGDIIVLPSGCQAIVAAEVADYLLSNWTRVHQVSVDVQEIDEEQLSVEPERIKEIRTTVARCASMPSRRAVMEHPARKSREIRAEKLKLNWKPVTNPALSVTEGMFCLSGAEAG